MKKLTELISGIEESPDRVYRDDDEIAMYGDEDAYAFGYYQGKFFIGDVGDTHYDIFNDIDPSYNDREKAIKVGELELSGRIWADKRIISFWQYPNNVSELRDVVKNLEDYLGIHIITNKKFIVDLNDSNPVSIVDFTKMLQSREVPEDPDAATMHTLSPLLKPKRKVPTGWGSMKLIGNKYTPGEWDAILGRAEGRIRLADLVLEKEIGQVSQNINVRIQVDKTSHAAERQTRDPQHEISEHDILETVHTALPKLSKMLLLSTVNIGDSILIRDTRTNLNIIGVLEKRESMIDLVVITVMLKKDFIPKLGTKIIEI